MKAIKVKDIRTNRNGKKFLDIYFDGDNVVNIETRDESRREYVIVYQLGNKSTYRTAVIPMEDGDTEPCFFGSLEYYARVTAAAKTGIKLHGDIWPSWNNDVESPQYMEFVKIYHNIINMFY